LRDVAWNCWRLECVDLYVGQEGCAPRKGIKRNRVGSAFLALDAELAFKETAFGLGSGSLAPNCGTSPSSCSPGACVSRRIESFFCAKRPAAKHAKQVSGNVERRGSERRRTTSQPPHPGFSAPRRMGAAQMGGSFGRGFRGATAGAFYGEEPGRGHERSDGIPSRDTRAFESSLSAVWSLRSASSSA
jgi:hypothetical protein